MTHVIRQLFSHSLVILLTFLLFSLSSSLPLFNFPILIPSLSLLLLNFPQLFGQLILLLHQFGATIDSHHDLFLKKLSFLSLMVVRLFESVQLIYF
jgi:hypothetical protein